MPVNLSLVRELRSLFKGGATPSALIRRIADRHSDDPHIDVLVRDYFREAFQVPMLRIGPEQVAAIAAGASLPVLNTTVVPRMIQTRPEWDDAGECWLDGTAVHDETELVVTADPQHIPELAGSWDRLDDGAKQFIRRIIGNARSAGEKLDALAVLTERLQSKLAENVTRSTSSAA